MGIHTYFAFLEKSLKLPWSNTFWPGLTPFGPLMWQAEADTELTLSASPTTAVGQKALALAKRRYSTVENAILTDCLLDLIPFYFPG